MSDGHVAALGTVSVASDGVIAERRDLSVPSDGVLSVETSLNLVSDGLIIVPEDQVAAGSVIGGVAANPRDS